MIKKYFSSIVLIFLIVSLSVLIKANYFKLKSIYVKNNYLWLTKNTIEKKNLKSQELLKNNKIFFEYQEYKFLKFPLDKYGVFFRDKYIHRPIGYLDVYKDRIILVTYDGSIFYSNNINEIKNNNLSLNKINVLNYDFDFNNEDKLNYRNIKIRDILVDEDKLYIVTNGRQKIDPNLKPGDKHDKNYYGSTNILVGKLNLDEPTIQLESFFSSGEEKYIINDWSHTGGRLVKYKNSSFLLAVPDYEIEYEKMKKLINDDKTIIGKVLLIKNGKSKIFSYGHRNPQGLFYDQENDLIFETEHGPQGGDEINKIVQGQNYGWPLASYGNSYFNNKQKYYKSHKKTPLPPQSIEHYTSQRQS